MPSLARLRCMTRNLPLLLVLAAAMGVHATEVDLNVTQIELTPKYNYDASKNRPAPGDAVVWHGYIRHWGDETSPVLPEVAYEWRVNGQVVATGVITDFEPLRPPFNFDYSGYPNPASKPAIANAANWPKNPLALDPNPNNPLTVLAPSTGLRLVRLPWTWQAGRQTVELVVDPQNLIPEKSEKNNRIRDYTDAILGGFYVEETTWRYFHLNQHKLPGQGRNSWEDWIQAHMAKQNELYQTAIYPGITPNGISTRVRTDRIIVVPDGMLPLNGGLATNNPERLDKTIDLMWGFVKYDPATSTFYSDHTSLVVGNPFFIETSLIHELGHARYLIDSYGFDVHDGAVQIRENGQLIAGTAYMPYLAWNALYYNQSGGVMTGPWGFVWSPYEAAMLERIGQDRARCGNMNSPCNIGEYLQELPQNNRFQFTDSNNWPRVNIQVTIYRATGQPVWYGKIFDDIPDAGPFFADENGWVNLGRNPFTGGPNISHTYGLANSVMILRIEQNTAAHGKQVWYRFVEASDFNIEYFKGHTQDAYYTFVLPGLSNDGDGNGLPDDWEMFYFQATEQDPLDDPDVDGLNNLQELRNRTHPLLQDTDDDGLLDGQEVLTYGTDPLNPDTDGDGWTDGEEVLIYGTDPLNPDTDGDGFIDSVDNCPLVYNPDQADWNNDGLGDACADPRVQQVHVAARTTVRILFTSCVDTASATHLAHYALDPPTAIHAAELTSPQIVTLTTAPLLPQTAYTLTLNAILDCDGKEIVPNTQVNLGFSNTPRVETGLLVRYDFDEGSGTFAEDTSGVGVALPLTVLDPASAQWTLSGLRLLAPTTVQSSVNATKIIDACRITNAVTMESWVVVEATDLFGPAVIATMTSPTSAFRNLTLGQGTLNADGISQFAARVRTSQTGSAGAVIASQPETVALGLQHVVFTRDAAGAAHLYVNGTRVTADDSMLAGTFSSWATSYRLTLGREPNGLYPWRGEYRLLAVYDRALSAAEVAQNFSAGPDPLPPSHFCPGDMNCDTLVDFGDISLFIAAIKTANPDAWVYDPVNGVCAYENGDFTGNGVVSFEDISGFIAAIKASPAPCITQP